MLAIDGEIAETLGYSRQVAEPPVPDPIEKLLSLELASIMSPLICRTVQRQLWTFYGYAYDALDIILILITSVRLSSAV
ncbi:Pro-interleukin-16 [Trichinella spiralis]|uniref:Pro-interleukin-16 n=1 Tax=Trichinella spiralis TaxID=6334 RepID=A0ABR3KDU5_TRISP